VIPASLREARSLHCSPLNLISILSAPPRESPYHSCTSSVKPVASLSQDLGLAMNRSLFQDAFGCSFLYSSLPTPRQQCPTSPSPRSPRSRPSICLYSPLLNATTSSRKCVCCSLVIS